VIKHASLIKAAKQVKLAAPRTAIAVPAAPAAEVQARKNSPAGDSAASTGQDGSQESQHRPPPLRDVGLVGPTPGHSDFTRENSSADDSVASTSHGGSQEGQRGSGLQLFSDFNVNLLLFHLRHNHYNQAMCKRMSNAVDGAPSFPVGAKLDKCIGCLLGKCVAHSVPKKRENAKENEPLKRKLFTDWWGPFHNVYIHGLVDDGSGAAWVFFSKQKNGKIAAENLARVEAQLIAALPIGTIISVVNSDSDSVFAQGDFEAYCVARRHAQRFSAP
jgi:hypothetical protein